MGRAQDIGEASVHNPEAIAFVDTKAEGGNDATLLFQGVLICWGRGERERGINMEVN